MSTTIIATLAISIVIISYVSTITALFGWLKSLSDSFYKWQERYKAGWVFQLFIFILATYMAYIGHDVLSYIASGLLSLVALSPWFRNEDSKPDEIDDIEKKIHNIGASGSIIVGLLDILIYHNNYIVPSICAAVIAIIAHNRKRFNNYTLWVELIAIIALIIGYTL